MTALRINLETHETPPGTNSGRSFGPVNVGAGYTVTKIRATGGISGPIVNEQGGGYQRTFLQIGLQHGATGYSPTSPESLTSMGTEWLAFRSVQPVSSELVTLHGAPGSDVSFRYQVDLEWRGQLYTPNGTDIYFSVGRIFNASLTWFYEGNLVAVYS